MVCTTVDIETVDIMLCYYDEIKRAHGAHPR